MFAASRTDKVIGRTLILIVSIKTRNGFNHIGAPSGNSIAINCFLLFINLDVIIIVHIGRPRTTVKIKWDLSLNDIGVRPIILIKIIIIKIDLIILIIPFIYGIFVDINCLKITDLGNFININNLLFIVHIFVYKKIIAINDIIIKILDGILLIPLNSKISKDEKISIIIQDLGLNLFKTLKVFSFI